MEMTVSDTPFANQAAPAPVKPPKPVRPRDPATGRLTARQPVSAPELPPEPAPEAAADAAEREHLMRLKNGAPRVPVSAGSLKLEVPERPGFRRRWVNDVPGRILRFEKAGYEIVSEHGRPKEHIVDKVTGLRAFLMEIPNEFYDADFAAKQEKLNDTDRQIYKGVHKQAPGDERYVPKGGIKIGVRAGD